MRYLLILLFAFLTACNSSVPTIKPYKMDIQQGNAVTSKMLLQLRPGMSKSQVRYIMGTPLITDSFHTNRWDYFFQLRQKGNVVEQRRVILEFENDKLARVRGDVVPAGSDQAGATESKKNAVVNVEPKPKQEQSWTDKLKFWKSDESEKQTANLPQPTEKQQAQKAETAKEEKSWTDKLKFWKSDDADKKVAEPAKTKSSDTPRTKTEVEVADVPAVAMPAAAEAVVESTEMAVKPMEFPVVKEELPAVSPKVPGKAADVPVPQPVINEPPKTTPVEVVEPVIATPTIKQVAEPVTKQPQKAPSRLEPIPASSGVNGDWRFERELHSSQLEMENPTPVKNMPVKPAETPPEEDTSPGYFERMLEKIGF